MSTTFTAAELEAYLDEALSPQEMAAIELELRNRPDLLRQLAEINNRRDAGIHSISAVWRRNRVSCPTRQQLGSFLLGAIDPQTAEYITFHVELVGCRYCRANLDDLQNQHQETEEFTQQRRKKYFQTSAGFLESDRGTEPKDKSQQADS